MNNDRLNSLAVLNIESDPTPGIDYGNIIQKLAGLKIEL